MNGLTLDTGALIALERRSRRMLIAIDVAFTRDMEVTVPAPVVVEWWRGQRGRSAKLLDAFRVEPLSDALARVAGKALAEMSGKRGPSVTDAVVMASAALRGDLVYTADIDDLERLKQVFPSVRLLRA